MSQKARPYNNFPVPNNLLKIQENGFHAPVDVVGGKNWVSVLHGVLLIGTPDPPITDVHWRRSPLIGTTVFYFLGEPIALFTDHRLFSFSNLAGRKIHSSLTKSGNSGRKRTSALLRCCQVARFREKTGPIKRNRICVNPDLQNGPICLPHQEGEKRENHHRR